MTLIDFSLYSPGIVAAIAVVVAIMARMFGLGIVGFKWLVGATVIYALIGFGLSLAFLVFDMYWYEKTTGYSAGNAPLFWMFFYGPLSIALGQFIALIHWLFKKQPNKSPQPTAYGGG